MENRKLDLTTACSNADTLSRYLQDKGKNHNCYKCYSTFEKIISIRDTRALYLNTGEKWNDLTDRNLFNNDEREQLNYGKCFSFSREESVAMWMLYGGLEKRGGMIDFTKKAIQSILEVECIEYGFFENGIFISAGRLSKPQFRVWITDVVYYRENHGGYYLKRSDESCETADKGVVEGLFACKKAYPWNYENECRLIISVEKGLITPKCDQIKIDLTGMDMKKSFERIYRSPNFSSKEYSVSLPSKLSNTIDWDLCSENCPYKKTTGKKEKL